MSQLKANFNIREEKDPLPSIFKFILREDRIFSPCSIACNFLGSDEDILSSFVKKKNYQKIFDQNLQ